MKPIQLKKLLHVTLARIIKGILDSSISRDDTGADGRCGRRADELLQLQTVGSS